VDIRLATQRKLGAIVPPALLRPLEHTTQLQHGMKYGLSHVHTKMTREVDYFALEKEIHSARLEQQRRHKRARALQFLEAASS
jgi:hypothetical protein